MHGQEMGGCPEAFASATGGSAFGVVCSDMVTGARC